MTKPRTDLFSRVPARLRTSPLEVLGQLLDSSNTTLLVAVPGLAGATDPNSSIEPSHAIYKPVAGERPLWDFPDGHLAHREVATWLVATAGGWDVVPPTVLRDGPFGPGSVQQWVTAVPGDAERVDSGDEQDDGKEQFGDCDSPAGATEEESEDLYEVDIQVENSDRFVDLFDPAALPAGWLPVLTGRLATGGRIIVAHADRPDLRSVAVLDAVLNNSDRKGSHLLVGRDGRLWCIDHGVTLHREDKLRTVLWGWAGRPIPAQDLARLARLIERLEAGSEVCEQLVELLTGAEIEALRRRCEALLRTGTHPHPNPDWPSVPWPAL